MIGPQSRSIAGLPARSCRERLAEPLDERFVGAPLDEHAAAGRARLPGVLDDCAADDRDGGVEVGVREHDLRRLAAELQRARDEVIRRELLDLLTDDRRAGEGDEVHRAVRGERRAGDSVLGR